MPSNRDGVLETAGKRIKLRDAALEGDVNSADVRRAARLPVQPRGSTEQNDDFAQRLECALEIGVAAPGRFFAGQLRQQRPVQRPRLIDGEFLGVASEVVESFDQLFGNRAIFGSIRM